MIYKSELTPETIENLEQNRENLYNATLKQYPAIVQENPEIVRASYDDLTHNSALSTYSALFCYAAHITQSKSASILEAQAHSLGNNRILGAKLEDKFDNILVSLRDSISEITKIDASKITDNIKDYLQASRLSYVVNSCDDNEDRKSSLLDKFNDMVVNSLSSMNNDELSQINKIQRTSNIYLDIQP